MMVCVCLALCASCGSRTAHIVSGHEAFGALDAASLRVMLEPRTEREAFDHGVATGRIIRLPAGSTLTLVEAATFTRDGIVPLKPHNSNHADEVDVDRVRVMEGQNKGLEVWVLTADVRFGQFPMP